MQGEQRRRYAVHRDEFRPESASALWKHEREVHQQSGLQQQRNDVAPIDGPVKRIQLAAVMEAVEHKRDQAKNVEMNGSRCVPAAKKNKKADEEIEQRRDPQVALNRRRVLLGRRDQRDRKRLTVPPEVIANFRPGA